MADTPDTEARTQEIGRALFAALAEQGPLRSTSSLLSGRAIQRRLLTQAVEDEHFRAQLFRFIDVYPSLRDSGDLVRHLRSYLDDRGETPPPLNRLLSSSAAQRLPSWAIARLTDRAMQRMAKGVVAGHDASEALPTLRRLHRKHAGFTIGILGETCLSEAEAQSYLRRCLDLIDTLAPRVATWPADSLIGPSPGGDVPRLNLSIKLSSVYSQIDPLDFEGSRETLVTRLKPLFLKAKTTGAFINLDSERFCCRDLTYAVFSDLALDEDLRDYPHMGIVIQAYLRDSEGDLRLLVDVAQKRGTPITVRLVKGAYWDYETISAAQEHRSVPVFTRKVETDAQFERLSALLVDNWQYTRPALGTHNIRSLAAGLATAETAGLASGAVEIQVLHGMAERIRCAAVNQGYRVREYVPVGESIPAMSYLLRRLLNNTSGDSFLLHTFAQQPDVDEMMAPPLVESEITESPEPAPAEETGEPAAVKTNGETAAPPVAAANVPPFRNEPHADFSRAEVRAEMERALTTIRGSLGREYGLVIDGAPVTTAVTTLSVNPARPDEVVGRVARATQEHADKALDAARAAFPSWRDTPPRERAAVLLRAAALMREQRFELAALEVSEAGKPWREADGDVTEAIDFLEYYAREMLRLYRARNLSDVPGEDDLYFYEPRGVAAVIAPWNFPLAIPTGMVSAALVAGNTVVFKPAGSTAVIGYALVRILHEAGVPGGALNFLPGPGAEVGGYLVADARVDLIAFTGSLEVGLSIMQKAATVVPGQRNIKKVVAELGGKNAIIVDTDADLDAAVEGVLVSAFGYAGQKCSACSRVIVLDEVYDQFLLRLTQAADSLKVGDPADPGTRLGPVITAQARDRVLGFIEKGRQEATQVYPAADRLSTSVTVPPAPQTAQTTAVVAKSASSSETTAAEEPAAATDVTAAPEAGTLQAATSPPATDADAGPIAESEETETDTPGAPSGAAPADTATQTTPGTDAAAPTATGRPGYFVRPHLFADVSPEGVLAQEEIFGPVLAVFKVEKFGEALDLALNVRYGLTGGLYSRNPAHIRRAYNEFRVGNLYINRPITGAMVGRQPFGGARMSGVGSKAGGPDYLLQFMEPRTITENTVRQGFTPPPED